MVDKYKEIRDGSLDPILEEKLLDNLRWAMLFFVFNNLCSFLQENEDSDTQIIQKEFFKNWKKFVNEQMIKQDIQAINEKLNSDINLFSSVLRGESEISESTEIYQKKYYEVLQKIENFYTKIVDDHIKEIGEDENE